jgi:hypothetical protein
MEAESPHPPEAERTCSGQPELLMNKAIQPTAHHFIFPYLKIEKIKIE